MCVAAAGVPLTAQALIGMAYGIPGSRVLDAPRWATDERYVIEARAAGISTLGEAGPLVMNLLSDRFKLVARKETRELPVHLLRVARTDGTLGPRMRKTDPDCLNGELRATAIAAAPAVEKQLGLKLESSTAPPRRRRHRSHRAADRELICACVSVARSSSASGTSMSPVGQESFEASIRRSTRTRGTT